MKRITKKQQRDISGGWHSAYKEVLIPWSGQPGMYYGWQEKPGSNGKPHYWYGLMSRKISSNKWGNGTFLYSGKPGCNQH